MGFLDSIFKDDKKKSNPGNPLGNMFGGQKTFQGAGQSLGGSKPGTVIAIVLPDAGPLGVRVEKRSNSEKTAIVHEVVPGGQAEMAGMQRGDILCFAGSNGQEEIMYDIFLDLAKSDQRPIELEVRRISTSLDKKMAAAPTGSNVGKSADAEARRKAVIAAAEAREKAHKKKSKPIKQVTKTTLAKQQALEQQRQLRQQSSSQEPRSEESRFAAEMAKHQEAQVAAQLGYNPYEMSRATAGQARTATNAVQHGSMNSNPAGDHHLSSVAPPKDAAAALEADGDDDDDDDDDDELPFEFQQAKATMVSSTNDKAALSSSCNIIKKLLVNATTKGQTPDEDAAKFRKVRLANAKIQAAIVNAEGAVELLLACGFWLEEQDGESVLLYPANTPGGPEWLPAALKRLEALRI